MTYQPYYYKHILVHDPVSSEYYTPDKIDIKESTKKFYSWLNENTIPQLTPAPKKIREKLGKKQPGRKLLTDYGLYSTLHETLDNDKRKKRWKKEQKKYGIDERNTWSFDTAYHQHLFENIVLFIEYSSIIDHTYNKITIKNVTKTTEEWMYILLHSLHYLLYDWTNNDNVLGIVLYKEVDIIFSELKPHLWW